MKFIPSVVGVVHIRTGYADAIAGMREYKLGVEILARCPGYVVSRFVIADGFDHECAVSVDQVDQIQD